jgi:thiamine-monophosphate kinase
MELEFIRRLRERLPPRQGDLLVGPGDDAAVLAWRSGGNCVVTTDMLTDGVDFRLSEADPRRIGRKALAVNLSDLAAMAAVPVAVVVSLALPRTASLELAWELYEGLLPLAVEFDTYVAGGDTNAWDGGLVINVTAIGRTTERGPLLRSGARPGDAIVVTGDFGGSILGKHFDFTPRVREALYLGANYEVRAAMDVSDGLSLDLGRMCEESGCGAELTLSSIPISAAAREAALRNPQSDTPLERALSDGEDFELLLAMPLEEASRAAADTSLGVGLSIIGRFVAERGLYAIDAAGNRTPLTPRGYEHRFGP